MGMMIRIELRTVDVGALRRFLWLHFGEIRKVILDAKKRHT